MDKKMSLAFYRFTRAHCLGAARFVSFWSAPAFFVIYTALAAYLVRREGFAASLPFFAVPAANMLLAFAIERIVRRPRPYAAMLIYPQPARSRGWSFPSNHTAAACIIAFACMTVNRPLGALVFCLAVITGLARVGTAAHYPSDVVFAVLQSAAMAAIGFNILPRYL